jgi:hypothetical protein
VYVLSHKAVLSSHVPRKVDETQSLERAAMVETLVPQKLGSGDCKNQDTQQVSQASPESSSGAANTTEMQGKTSPTYLEVSREPNSDPMFFGFGCGTCF